MMATSGTETMVYGGNGKQLESTTQPQENIEAFKDSSFSPLRDQNSLLSLTLNEIQLKRGKSVGSMSMDEFLANLWSNVDENQLLFQQNKPINEDTTTITDHNNNNVVPLARQGSFSVPTPLCKKTVDEVWVEIQKDQTHQENVTTCAAQEQPPPQSQQTLGEITLEDFLIKAGVVQEAPATVGSSHQKSVAPLQNASMDVNVGTGQVVGLGFAAHPNVVSNNGFIAYQVFQQGKGYVGGDQATSTNNGKNDHKGGLQNCLMEMGPQPNKKRIIDGPPEVVVERRQRRMIKNRESAARSRARKQAYTVELELELNQLKEENAKLKEIVEEIEEKRKEEVIRRKSSIEPRRKANKMRTIRRTASVAW
ncbi:hypothetical protein Tsubulata_010245 [Turnera subulata]|uniref:BZIP domain-containing protein n=1 Tax=Turnera subulata TaxID=218843 RepID=A0A9Q0GBN3_9ROSI|nr:hypothetical protein Tsubulata_010245 [Turnera subulata]